MGTDYLKGFKHQPPDRPLFRASRGVGLSNPEWRARCQRLP
jgi:hypothetical protein